MRNSTDYNSTETSVNFLWLKLHSSLRNLRTSRCILTRAWSCRSNWTITQIWCLYKKSLQRTFGAIDFDGKFIPNLSATTASLRTLVTNAVEWNRTKQHESEWQYIEYIYWIVKQFWLKYLLMSQTTALGLCCCGNTTETRPQLRMLRVRWRQQSKGMPKLKREPGTNIWLWKM